MFSALCRLLGFRDTFMLRLRKIYQKYCVIHLFIFESASLTFLKDNLCTKHRRIVLAEWEACSC